MALQKGDFIIVDYTAKIKETGEIFDTTSEETAKKEKLHKEGDIYEPKLVVVGEGWVLKALDEALPKLKIKKKDSVEIPPEKALDGETGFVSLGLGFNLQERSGQAKQMIPFRKRT